MTDVTPEYLAAIDRLLELADRQRQPERDLLDERPGAGGALAVHAVREPLAGAVDTNHFGVLPADVYPQPHVGKHAGQSSGVTAKLGYLPVGEGHVHTAVARGDHVRDVVVSQPRFLESDYQRLGSLVAHLFWLTTETRRAQSYYFSVFSAPPWLIFYFKNQTILQSLQK